MCGNFDRKVWNHILEVDRDIICSIGQRATASFKLANPDHEVYVPEDRAAAS